ncbi:MAG: hypothetical protein HY695_11555 [Deltaproteobacteria bacterium]|nr:hypothetical protein [Deltaproteobacteria bacterium]
MREHRRRELAPGPGWIAPAHTMDATGIDSHPHDPNSMFAGMGDGARL